MTTVMNGGLSAPKQIRFVNNQGQPPSKRRRINAACLTCRKRKTRCAGERPTCSTCANNGQLCQGYTDPAEKRKEEEEPEAPLRPGQRHLSHGSLENEEVDAVEEGEDEEEGGEEEEAEEEEEARLNCKTEVEEKPPLPSAVSPRPESELRTQRSEWDRDADDVAPRPAVMPAQRTVSFSADSRAPNKESTTAHPHGSHRVPYFRYFGPTAIVPGFKQMVVNLSVRDRRRSRGGSFSTNSPGSSLSHAAALSNSSHHEPVFETLEETPVYDPNDPGPVHPLIVNLIKTFFSHLGCNYPFLRERRVIRMLKEKRLEPILVDAMCALAARFSDLPIIGGSGDSPLPRSEYGNVFAQRAKAATVDTFPCPSVGAVQAFLLMAYEAFGANQDSALWMYLGLAIRMAVDLGLQKMVGVKYQGERDPWYARRTRMTGDADAGEPKPATDVNVLTPQEQHEVEQERVDTFWSTFVLDRFISSGTGRPVTIGDDDFELHIPDSTVNPVSGWPAPFPVFIKIIQLYGRVSDVLNHIRDAKDLTPDKLRRLAHMENDLTRLYQKQDTRLAFNVFNFQEYVKAGQGTVFILLHFWFHALIIILHQPTLLTPFASIERIHQLLPNSRELSMSSAKTIADILAFAELIDPKSFIGNPFTSQPMYIAACAFLMESVANSSNPTSRDATPPDAGRQGGQRPGPNGETAKSSKHSLLASAANQNYQRCYKSLQQLHTYWGGVKYILTALDQKSKGIWDCETYTNEEYESARVPPQRKDLGYIQHASLENPNPASPKAPPIAWSLTGTTNSPNSSLTLLYQNMAAANPQHPPVMSQPGTPSAPTPPGNMIYDPIRQSVPEVPNIYAPAYPQPNISAVRYSVQRNQQGAMSPPPGPAKSQVKFGGITSDDLGVSTMSPTQPSSYASTAQPSSYDAASMLPGAASTAALTESVLAQHHQRQFPDTPGHGGSGGVGGPGYGDFAQSGLTSGSYSFFGPGPITDVITYDSQDIDIAALGLPNELMPSWLEYLPGDVLGLFDGYVNNGGAGGQGHMG